MMGLDMGLREALGRILNFGKASDERAEPPASMVLLLREESFPRLEQLRQAAERAFGTPFSLDKNSRHCVYTQILFTLMRVGPHTVSFMFYAKPYGENSQELGMAWPVPSQRQAWAEHTAWMAIDYAKGGIDFDSRYAVVARLCRELYDANCLGVYLPRERAFVPDERSARAMFDRVITQHNVDVA
jgi:hypothetical protein